MWFLREPRQGWLYLTAVRSRLRAVRRTAMHQVSTAVVNDSVAECHLGSVTT